MCVTSEMQAGAKLSLNRKFVDDRWSKQRVVTCLDWSPQVRDLLNLIYVKTLSINIDFHKIFVCLILFLFFKHLKPLFSLHYN